MAKVLIEESTLTEICDAIRSKKGTTDAISVLNIKSEIESITGGGESSDLVKYVSFMSEDGATELFKMPVLSGDDCKDPIEHGDIETPTKESTEAYNYSFSGWAMIAGNPAASSPLSNITEDRTVYAAFEESTRYYTINFYDGETLVNSEQVAYGGSSLYIYQKEGYQFDAWNPEPVNVVENIDCYAQMTEISLHEWIALGNTSFYNNESAPVVYNNELLLLGGASQSQTIYKWDGNNFIATTDTLPIRNAAGSQAVVVNGEIHVVGLVADGAATYITKGHAKWTGTAWEVVSTDVPGTFNYSWSAVNYNDELHILAGNLHHKWNGSQWVSNITTPNNTNNRYVVFNGEIHGLGTQHYKWDGNTWTELGTPPVKITTSDRVVVFEDEIHVLQKDLSHYKWDGNTWTQLDNMTMSSFNGNKAVVYNGYIHVFGNSTNKNMHYMY